MGRKTSDDECDKSSDKGHRSESRSDSDSDLEEEEYIVEKVLGMRTTRKGKIECEC